MRKNFTVDARSATRSSHKTTQRSRPPELPRSMEAGQLLPEIPRSLAAGSHPTELARSLARKPKDFCSLRTSSFFLNSMRVPG